MNKKSYGKNSVFAKKKAREKLFNVTSGRSYFDIFIKRKAREKEFPSLQNGLQYKNNLFIFHSFSFSRMEFFYRVNQISLDCLNEETNKVLFRFLLPPLYVYSSFTRARCGNSIYWGGREFLFTEHLLALLESLEKFNNFYRRTHKSSSSGDKTIRAPKNGRKYRRSSFHISD